MTSSLRGSGASRPTGNPVARPSKYHENFLGIATRLALGGKTDQQIAEIFGVSRSTLNSWKKAHPEFQDAINNARAPADGRVAASLWQAAIGYSHPEEKIMLTRSGRVVRVMTTKHYPPNAMAAMYWLNNRDRQYWYQTTARKPSTDEDPKETAQTVADALRAMRDVDGLYAPLPGITAPLPGDNGKK